MASISRKLFNWETLPFAVLYAPLSIFWLYYILKTWRIWWFMPVDPTLEFSGFEGEGKKEMYQQLPKWSIPTTLFFNPKMPFAQVVAHIANANLNYPIITKPDKGMQGVLFRIIDTETQLKKYHTAMHDEYIVQPFIKYPIELSVFYIRYPNQTKGKVTGFISKEYLQVKGNGSHTLLQLIKAHPKAHLRMDEMTHKHQNNFNNIIPINETYFLSYAGNHNRGAKFINLHTQIDTNLQTLFDKISLHSKAFYYGRYDVKCQTIADLKAGKNFSILEFNGAGAEPNHIYDCNMGLRAAYKEILTHWAHMYAIAQINLKAGHKPWSAIKGFKFLMQAKKDFKQFSKLDLALKI